MNGRGRLYAQTLLTAFAVGFQQRVGWLLQQQVNRFDFQVLAFQFRNGRIEDDLAVIDDDGTAADLLDIPGIVRGQKDGDAFLLVQLTDQVTYTLFGNHIQPDRRLIQKEDGGFMQQGRGQFAAHTLPQAQLTHRRANVFLDIKAFDQEVAPLAVLMHIQFINLGQQVEGILRRQVIPQLSFLPIDTGYTKS